MTLGNRLLDNGIRIVAAHRPEIPAVAVTTCIGVGSDDDPEDLPGLAHLVEHLMFPRADGRSADGQPGMHSARTGHQVTEFSSIGPAELLAGLLGRQRDLLDPDRPLAVGSSCIEAESAVIALESFSARCTPYLFPPWSAVPATLFGADPDHHDGFGDAGVLAAADPGTVIDFLDRHRRTSPAVIAVVGDLGAGGVEAAAELAAELLDGLPQRGSDPGRRLRPRPGRAVHDRSSVASTGDRETSGAGLAGMCLAIPDAAGDLPGYAAAVVAAGTLTRGGRGTTAVARRPVRAFCGYGGRPLDRAGTDIVTLMLGLPAVIAADEAAERFTRLLTVAAGSGPRTLDPARRICEMDAQLRAGSPSDLAGDLARSAVLFGTADIALALPAAIAAVRDEQVTALHRAWADGPSAVTVIAGEAA